MQTLNLMKHFNIAIAIFFYISAVTFSANASASDEDCYAPYNECLLNSRDVTPCGIMFDQCKANRQMIAPSENSRASANASYEAKKECDLERQSCRLGNSMRGWNNDDGECDYRWRQCLKNHQ